MHSQLSSLAVLCIHCRFRRDKPRRDFDSSSSPSSHTICETFFTPIVTFMHLYERIVRLFFIDFFFACVCVHEICAIVLKKATESSVENVSILKVFFLSCCFKCNSLCAQLKTLSFSTIVVSSFLCVKRSHKTQTNARVSMYRTLFIAHHHLHRVSVGASRREKLKHFRVLEHDTIDPIFTKLKTFCVFETSSFSDDDFSSKNFIAFNFDYTFFGWK